MGPEQGCAPVHVILRLEDVHHLVRVELEHTLHIHAVSRLGGLLGSLLGLPLLHLLAPLALPDPPQVPCGEGITDI